MSNELLTKKLKSTSAPVISKLRVTHFPQVGNHKYFTYEVPDEDTGVILIDALAKQHLFLFDNNFIPDYSNIIYLERYNEEEKQWENYCNELGEETEDLERNFEENS